MLGKKIKTFIFPAIIHILILITFIICFKDTIEWLVLTYINPSSYEFGVLFLLLLTITIAIILKNKNRILNKVGYSFSLPMYIGLTIFLSLNVLNKITLNYHIISEVCLIFAFYFILGFYIVYSSWKRGLYLLLIFCLSLPLLNYLQVFIGFPLRLMTAKIISSIFSSIEINTISESTVITLENTMTSIDYPCSGLKSIYTGSIFMLAVYFLKNVKLSLQIVIISIIFYLLLIFFNTWRVFSLVFITSLLHIHKLADSVHTLLGIISFVISCIVLYYLTEKLAPLREKNICKEITEKHLYKGGFSYIILLMTLVFFIFLGSFPLDNNSKDIQYNLINKINKLSIPAVVLTPVDLSLKEKKFFSDNKNAISQKYNGVTLDGNKFVLLIVTSKNWRYQHNPEICIQGQGYKILTSEIKQINRIIFKIIVLSNKKTLIYWFTDYKNTSYDYCDRVWGGILNPGKQWTLIEIGFNKIIDINKPEIINLIKNINNAINVK